MREHRKAFDDMLIEMREENYDVVVDRAISYIECLENRIRMMRQSLIYSLEKAKNLDCECDEYAGFTCGKHVWVARLEQMIKETDDVEEHNNGTAT